MDARDPRTPTPAELESRTVLDARWEALRREAIGQAPEPRRKLAELGRECEELAIIAAWFEAGGNITRAAERLGTGRKVVRERVVKWRRAYPHLVPSSPVVPPKPPELLEPSKPRLRKRKTEADEREAEASIP